MSYNAMTIKISMEIVQSFRKINNGYGAWNAGPQSLLVQLDTCLPLECYPIPRLVLPLHMIHGIN